MSVLYYYDLFFPFDGHESLRIVINLFQLITTYDFEHIIIVVVIRVQISMYKVYFKFRKKRRI